MRIFWVLLVVLTVVSRLTAALDLNEVSIDGLQQKMRSGELSSEQITEYYLHQIITYNPQLKAVISVSPNALEDARKADAMRRSGNLLGPMHGIPVLVKDNIDTKELANTAGSYLLRNHYPKRDAFAIKQLRAAGAIVLGKANLSEWANFRSTKSSSGWSGMGKQAANPYDLTRSPCGSSAGSGVAVAANLAPVAIGTETDGSVTCPAAMNGIVGIKPTLGLISRHGIIPISKHQDTAGPMAKTVTDAVYLLAAMTGKDSKDAASFAIARDLTTHLKLDGLANKRIGLVTNLVNIQGEMAEVFNRAIAILKTQGATIVEDVELPNATNLGDDEGNLLFWSFKDEVADYLDDFPNAPAKTLTDLIRLNKQFAAIELEHFGQEIFEISDATRGEQEPQYQKTIAKLKNAAGKEGIDKALAEHRLDILVAPTVGPAWKIDHLLGDNYAGSATSPAAISGYPHITVPMGFIRGLPVGLSFFSGKHSEPVLIEAAYSYEQASKERKAPDLSQLK